jgi:iron complex outermembrane recepter protein
MPQVRRFSGGSTYFDPEGERRSAMKRVFVLALLFSVVVISPAQAQNKKNTDTTVTMQEVVVTATRDTQEIRKAPANVTVITAEEINATGATTVVEALDKIESVQFRTLSGNASQAYVDVRGFGGDNPYGKTLVLLDGRRLNRPDMASINWLQMPVNTIERIEIVRGPGSVLYGDAAIGGTINIITKKGKGEPKFNASVLAGSYGQNDERAGVTGATGKWTYALTGENNFNFGYRDRSKYSARGGGFDVGYAANDLFNASMGVSFDKVDYQLPGALTKLQMEQDRRQFQPAMPEFFMNANSDNDGSDKYTNINLGLKSFFGAWGQLEINLLYGKKDLQSNMPSWVGSYKFADTNADTYAIMPKYILTKEVMGFPNKVIAGVDYYNEPYKKDTFRDRERTDKLSSADFTRASTGYYIRDEFGILKNLILTAGYRFERTSIKGSNVDSNIPDNDFSNEKFYSAESYETGLTLLLGRQSKLFAKYATVYRIPFLDEVASFNGFGGSFLTSLEKEKGISMEAGAELYPLTNLKAGLTAFRIDMEDEISWFASGPFTGFNKNQDKTRHQGIEFSISYLWPKIVRCYGNYTYHLATFEDGINNKKEVPMVPNHVANAGLEVFLPYNVSLRPEIKYVASSFLSGDNDNNAEKLDSFTLLNVYVNYKPAWGKLGITAFFGVENIADVKYSSFGLDYEQFGMPNFYYPMPGRIFKGGISFDF